MSLNITTVGDYAAQAVISSMLHRAFPKDPIVGEEDAAELREDSGATLRDRIVSLANEALTGELGIGENAEWGVGPGQEKSTEELLDAIDRGNHEGGRTGSACVDCIVLSRSWADLDDIKGMWTIDPIDGTKGFLRGGQYAVCLAFIVDAKVQVGVIGCPNLPVDPSRPEGDKGCIFVAVRGQGAQQVCPPFNDVTLL